MVRIIGIVSFQTNDGSQTLTPVALFAWENLKIAWLLHWITATCSWVLPNKWLNDRWALPMQGWGLHARPSSTVPSHTPSSGWQPRLRTWTPPPHSWLHTDQRPQPAQPSAGRDKKRRSIEQSGTDIAARNVSNLDKAKFDQTWFPSSCTKKKQQKKRKRKLYKSMSQRTLCNFICKDRMWVMFVLCAENEQGQVFVSRTEHSSWRMFHFKRLIVCS